jgi:membrane-associated phospholipid phosphatase
MEIIKTFLIKLKAYDLVVIHFYFFLLAINIFYHDRINLWVMWTLLDLGIIFFTLMNAYFENKYNNKFWRASHYWYIAPLILFTFKELYYLIAPIRQQDFDWLFIEIDRWMFGGDPAKFLLHYSFPLLTELLEIVYSMFYFLPIILSIALLKKNRFTALDFAVFSIIYGFYLSYLGYFTLPAIGPRFTLHNFSLLDQQLPGVFLTPYLRKLIDIGESIPKGTIDPAAVVQKDAFPSGHTMITLIVIYLSIKLKSRTRFFIIPVGTLLIFATVYLWYHYVIDLIGGLVFMIFSIWSGKYIFNWWRRIQGEEEFDYRKY